MTRPGGFVSGDVLTAPDMNALPAGYYSAAFTGSAQTGIGSTATDLTSQTVSITTVASRRYLITALVNFRQRTAQGLVTIEIMRGATLLNSAVSLHATDEYGTLHVMITDVPGAGSTTYKLRAKTSGGTVDVNSQASSTIASGLVVEDIGT